MKCYNPSKASVAAYLQRVLFVHRNTAQRSGRTPAEILIGRSVRCPIANGIAPMESVLYRENAARDPVPVRFLYRQGANTSLVARANNRTMLEHDELLSLQQRDADGDSDCDSEEDACSETRERRNEPDRIHPVRERAAPDFFGDLVLY